jgi:hypothetical protein
VCVCVWGGGCRVMWLGSEWMCGKVCLCVSGSMDTNEWVGVWICGCEVNGCVGRCMCVSGSMDTNEWVGV